MSSEKEMYLIDLNDSEMREAIGGGWMQYLLGMLFESMQDSNYTENRAFYH